MNRSETISLLGFVPALVVQYLSETKKNVKLPAKQTFKSVVMFADISGFTNLTETLNKLGPEGCEMTAFAINRYMELLVKAIGRSGGDIFKFAGDAMIVVWPPPEEGKTSLEKLCRQAIQSALDIQAKLHDTYILNNIKLSVKIGFGIGQISIVYTGGIFDRCEYLASGDPLTQAFHAEHHAEKGGETLISQEVFEMVKDFFDVLEDPQKNPECYHVLRVKDKVRMKADALIIKNNLDMLKFEKVKKQLLGYIPAALLPYIENGQETWGNELRQLTIMFLNLGVDLSSTQTQEGLQRIQNVIETVQKCIYMHEGSLNKLLMDDKGSTLIVVFGLPPMCHQDDAARAILTANLLTKELKKLQCPISIGIATGKVFAGVVGTSGSRREYSVLGDEVNLAARLMQLACQEKREKIILCGTTKEQSGGTITSVFFKEVKLKGKAQPVKTYVPFETKQVSFMSQIKIHHESVLIKYEEVQHLKQSATSDGEQGPENKKSFITVVDNNSLTPPQPLIGNEKTLSEFMKITHEFLLQVRERQLVIIRGGFGMGKSHALKICLTEALRRIDKQEYGKFKNQESPNFVVTALNPVERKLKINGLRSVCRQLLNVCANRMKRQVHAQFLGEVFEETRKNPQYDKYFKEFCQLINPPLEPIQNFPAPFPEASKEEVKAIQAYVSALFSRYLELEVQKRKVSVMQRRTYQYQEFVAPLVLIYPNAEHLDASSFQILKHVMKRYEFMLVLLVRDEYIEIPMVGARTQADIQETLETGISNIVNALDSSEVAEFRMTHLNRKPQFKDFIKLHFGIEEFREEVDLTQVEDDKDQEEYFRNRSRARQKPPEEERREELMKQKLQDHLLFSESKHELINLNLSEYVYHFLYIKTKGHPLATRQWLEMLVRTKYLAIEHKTGIVQKEFKKLLDHEETIIVDSPFIFTQINGQIIDKLGCFSCLILKVASVIGDIFDLNTLSAIQPFQEVINNESLVKHLDDLVARDIIEVMDVKDQNRFYRFAFPFFRECIYQRMTYAQRRLIHQQVAESYQLLPQVSDYDEKLSEKKLVVQWELTEQTQESQINVSHKAKRAFIVKKLRQMLTKENDNVLLYQGSLKKKSEQNITWSLRHCTLTPHHFVYYYSANDTLHPLGQFHYKHIQTVTVLNEPTQTQKLFGGQQNVLTIKVSQWAKKQKTLLEERKFYFAADNEEVLEQWVIYIEFMKAKAVYDEFVAQFGKIPFPLQAHEHIVMKRNTQKFNFRNEGGHQVTGRQRLLSNRISRPSIMRSGKHNMYSSQMLSVQDEPVSNWQTDIQNLKPYLQVFMIKSLYVFFAHLFQVGSTKVPVNIGDTIQIMVRQPQIFSVGEIPRSSHSLMPSNSFGYTIRLSNLNKIHEEEEKQ